MKFLVIDDEPLVRRSLVRAIKARGHECAEAADGEDGLKLWESESPQGVFVDVLMPGLSGPEVVSRARANRVLRPSFIALISAFSGDDSEKLALECGADIFIGKPFADIFHVVDQVVDRVVKLSGEL
ncbi:MAG: response regulator [Deltaproteobacteria bacterium]|nr:response regulator [Deltaproteobacteria bacterium]